ncbi:phospholipid-transporting ATPase ABCA3-like isoform X2 [Tubulanus polymorphus]|uniref:phospholipid-transporting ATPase ABCA3-like isoform X2 n=1 Tax=Tubulanus polymorphus TaxID=672921 RepID=UPI003DA57E6B
MGALRQFRLLLWKNFVLHKRKCWVTIIEVAIPAVFAIILFLVRLRVAATNVNQPTEWQDYGIASFPKNLTPDQFETVQWRLAYCPNDDVSKLIVQRAGALLNIVTEGLGFPTEKELVTYLSQVNKSTHDVLGGVVFTNSWNRIDNSSERLSYKIRLNSSPRNAGRQKISMNPFGGKGKWLTEFAFPLFQKIGPREKEHPWGGSPGYMREGFVTLQHALDKSIIIQLGGNAEKLSKIEVHLQRFPFPPYNDDPYILVIQQQLPLVLVLSFIFSALNIAKNIVHEKERKLKESMKMMGLSGWLHWAAWFTSNIILLTVSVGIMTVFLSIQVPDQGGVVNHSDPSVIFFFLFVFSMTTITFCFMISVFFKKANSGAAAGGILFYLTYVPYTIIQPRYESMNYIGKLGCCFISNVAMSLGGQIIGMHEGTGAGLQWSNINKPPTVDDDFSMLDIIIMLLLDMVLYMAIAWYVEAVAPGEYGLPQPWYFPLQCSYWCGTKVSPLINDDDDENQPLLCNEKTRQMDFFEKNPTGLKAGIKIRNLTKEYSSGAMINVAVSEMTLDMFEGQITALLGHNGAGKTTTMSMLTGFIPSTSGTAKVNGYDIRTDITNVRRSLGLCPQHDILFDHLTVYEHLLFFCKLKGYNDDDVESEIACMIQSLGLEEKHNAQSKTLSGGMKRKLSVGIALIGGSKVVILDEPTSGMDPDARRHTWDILQKHRQGRTILLSTHFMEEADLLGDRIAIMAAGVIQCCGTSLFLKKRYGAGYHMVIVKHPNCDVSLISNVISKHVPSATLESNISAELTYILPQESSDQFEALFTELEQNKDDLGISSYGASVTTMEEVFLRVGESSDGNLKGKLQHDSANSTSGSLGNEPALNRSNALEFDRSMEYNTGFALYAQQFYAMFYKRVLHTWRNRIVTMTQLAIPLVFTILVLAIVKTLPKIGDSPPMMLDLERYPKVHATISDLVNTSLVNSLHKSYGRQFKLQSNVHIRSVKNLTDYLVKQGLESLYVYSSEYLIGATFSSNNGSTLAVGGFQDQAYHTPGITLNLVDNALLHHLTNLNYTIHTTNHPLPRTTEDKINDSFAESMIGFSIAIFLCFGMSFLASSFVLFLVKERSSKVKHSQFVSGVNTFMFWLSTFSWDIINYIIPCLLLLVTFAAFDVKAYISDYHLFHILLLFMLYGWSILPFMYLLSFLFTVPSTGFVWLTMLNVLSGIGTTLAVDILSIPQLDTGDLSKVLEWIFFLLIPNFCLGRGLEDYYANYEFLDICLQYQELCKLGIPNPCCKGNCGPSKCIDYQENYLSMQQGGIGRPLVFMFLQGVGYFMLVFALESQIFHRLWSLLTGLLYDDNEEQNRADQMHETITVGDDGPPVQHQSSQIEEDSDVAVERQRINDAAIESLFETDSVILHNVVKYYDKFLAVDHLNLGIPQGECFGLLGVNGAGKTTTFKMLTGDEVLSGGEAYMNGFNVRNSLDHVRLQLGYCPQFDALIDQMTGVETLTMFARLRGVKEVLIPHMVERLIVSLLLDKHAHKLVKSYSGGNKRKLSTAIALIGDPPIVFLDEPTTGMDPVAKRMLWDTLSNYREQGKTLVLTSHSMEECEALCTRLAIMVNGQFKCLGSPQHLKYKFGEGYTLLAKVGPPTGGGATDLQPLMQFIETTFPSAHLKDIHQGLVHYHITDTSLSWAKIFGTLERAKTVFNIEDYSVSQTTLEQVFLNFARVQEEPQLTERSICNRCCRCMCCCSLIKCCRGEDELEPCQSSEAPLSVDV